MKKKKTRPAVESKGNAEIALLEAELLLARQTRDPELAAAARAAVARRGAKRSIVRTSIERDGESVRRRVTIDSGALPPADPIPAGNAGRTRGPAAVREIEALAREGARELERARTRGESAFAFRVGLVASHLLTRAFELGLRRGDRIARSSVPRELAEKVERALAEKKPAHRVAAAVLCAWGWTAANADNAVRA